MNNLLTDICNEKKKEIEALKLRCSLKSLQKLIGNKQNREFKKILKESQKNEKNNIIAEIKQSSPSAGEIIKDYYPEDIAVKYEKAGAGAISILTEKKFFKGSIDHLSLINSKTNIPILRKDFIIHEYQIYEARILDADCVLLIASILNDEQISHFIDVARSLNLDCLMEVHDQDELNRIESIKDVIIGVNNRNLKTFEVDISLSVKLKNSYQGDNPFVAESGIKSQEDLDYLMNNGINNFLIGESLMKKNLQI